MPVTQYNPRVLVILLVVFAVVIIAQEEEPAGIAGEVVVQYGKHVTIPGYAGRTLPKKNFPVYLFEWNGSAPLRQWLRKLERDIEAANQDRGDSDKWWIVEKRREDAYEMIILDVTAKRTRTDEKGCFVFKDLEPGSKYIVIATDDVYELGIILLYEAVGPLKPGKNEIRIVEKIG